MRVSTSVYLGLQISNWDFPIIFVSKFCPIKIVVLGA